MISDVQTLQALISEAATKPYNAFVVGNLRKQLEIISTEKFTKLDGKNLHLRHAVYTMAQAFCQVDDEIWRQMWAVYLHDLVLKLEAAPAQTLEDMTKGLALPDDHWVKPRKDLR